MNGSPRQKRYLWAASALLPLHLIVAALAKPSFALTLFGDIAPCALMLLAVLAVRENARSSFGMLRAFWKVFAAGLSVMLLSQAYWLYFDTRPNLSGSPVLGDSLFLIAQVFFLSALALRPYASSGGSDLHIRSLDFLLLSLWWLFLYVYFAFPWKALVNDDRRYNLNYCLVASIELLLIITALVFLSIRKQGAWRRFYVQLIAAFVLLTSGNLLISGLGGTYYTGGFYDTPFLLGIYLFVVLACCGASLQAQDDGAPARELQVSVWTARFAMLVMLSLPILALWGLAASDVPQNIQTFRLRLVFVSMFLLGGLVYWKLNLLTHELLWLVRLTRNSIENLKGVQQQVSQSEKFVALGRLAAGAAHEISNPLTAILGYSELLADIPSLSAEDRARAKEIRDQVHRAQAVVASLRGRMGGAPILARVVDKKPLS